MATHQVTAAKWDSVLSAKGAAEPGDTVELLPGEYTGREFPILRSGTVEAPIIIIAQPDAVFNGAYQWPADSGAGGLTSRKGVRAVYAGLVAVRTSYVTLRNFHVTHSQGRGISIYGKAGARIVGVAVENSHIAFCRLNCIATQQGSYVTIRGNDIHDGNNYISGEGDGVSSAGTWGAMCQCVDSDHVVYVGNHVHHGWGEGIVVQFNTEDCEVNANLVGDTASGKIYGDRAVRLSIIDNVVYDTADPAILKGTQPSTGISCRNEVHNRVAPPLSDLRISGNVVVGCAYGATIGGTQKQQTDPLTNIDVHNNTFANNLEGAMYLSNQPVHKNCTINGNLLYQPDGKFYSVDSPHAGYKIGPNGYSGPKKSVPVQCQHPDDHYGVALANPDAPIKKTGISLADYAPMADYSGMGAIEYVEEEQPPSPPLPVDEIVKLSLSVKTPPALAVELRKVLAGAVVSVE